MPSDGFNGANLMGARQQPKIPILDFLSAQEHAIMAILPGSSDSSQAHSSQERDGRSSSSSSSCSANIRRRTTDAKRQWANLVDAAVVVLLLQHYNTLAWTLLAYVGVLRHMQTCYIEL